MDIAALKRDLDGHQDRGQSEDRPAEEPRLLLVQPGAEAPARPCHRRSVVSPKSEAEVIRVLAACHRHGVPVTPRGTGTGNYGQAMPLSGGVVLSLADMNEVTSIAPGRVVSGPGRDPRRHRPGDARAFRPGTAAASLDLQHRLDRRLHRRRLGRRRLDQFRRPARFRQRHPAARRHHGGRAAGCSSSPARICTR